MVAKVTGVINYVHDIAHEPHDVDVVSGDDVLCDHFFRGAHDDRGPRGARRMTPNDADARRPTTRQ